MSLLLLGGLVGLHAEQSEAAGRLGLAGFLIAFLGSALLVGLFFTQAFLVPYLAVEFPEVLDAGEQGLVAVGFGMTLIVFPVGWLLLAVATLRTRIYPRAAAILLIIGTVVTFVPIPLSTIVLNVAVAWLGLSLLAARDAPVRQPARMDATTLGKGETV